MACEQDTLTCARLYVEERLTCAEIARRLGMHPVTVRLRLDACGVWREKGSSRRQDADLIRRIRQLTAQGVPQVHIARRLGCSRYVVRRWQSTVPVVEVP